MAEAQLDTPSPRTMGRDAILGEIARRREKIEAETMAESRVRHDAILEQILMLAELNKQDESDAMEGERQRDVVMQEHKRDIADQLEQEWTFRQAEIERQTALPTFDTSIEEQAQIREQLKAAQAQERAAMDAILEQVTAGEAYKLQNLKERSMVHEAWRRQDEILAEIQKRRASAVAAKRIARERQRSKPEPEAPEITEKSLVLQLRSIRSREVLAGRLSNQAADARDKAAWERAGKIIDKLYAEREALLERLRKTAGKERADQVYDELYIRGKW